ncbi:hypothetical protein CR152_04735 [Massilia violaceinigra]|uniref:Pilus assembly protein n=1 Tax=Massilia violaceinigra TaxID=2045208 RepID=A0A2D2DG41_9BURK|nr:hypothetical protein [Massilia violaceinigra]ATQ73899.1 hypothetical protein CR152_04735 [Massilia violaceinigra]
MNTLICRAALPVLAMLAGCAAAPRYDARFGDAVREARSAMTIDPQAGATPDPVAGIDGQAARDAMTRYQDSFKAPPPVVNVINIGGPAAK